MHRDAKSGIGLDLRAGRGIEHLRDGWPHQNGLIFVKIPNGLSENHIADLSNTYAADEQEGRGDKYS